MALQVGELFALLTADDSGFNDTMDSAGSKFSKVGQKMQDVGSDLTKKVTLPLVGMGLGILKLGGDFEESSNKVATIMDTNVMSLDQMKKGVLDLSDKVGESANDINNALYQTISATGDTANALAYTEIAAKAAIGGFTDTETAIDGLTSVMNAYGMSGVEDMQKVADMMIQTQNVGKTTMGELSASLFQVIPTAAALGIGFDQVSAGMAAITAQGTPTSVAATQLRQLFVELSKASGKTAKLFTEISGQSFKDFVSSGGDVQSALALMEKYAIDNNVALSDLFGSVEAGAAALQLTGDGAKKFADDLTAIEDSAGSVDNAYAIMDSGTNDSVADMINSLKNLGIELSDVLAPTVMDVLSDVQDMIDGFKGLDDQSKESIVKFALLAAAAGPVAFVLGGIFKIVGFVATGLGALSGVLTTVGISAAGAGTGLTGVSVGVGALSLPVLGLIALVLAVVSAFVYLMITSKDFRDTVAESFRIIYETGKEMLGGLIEFLYGALKMISGLLMGDFEQAFEGFKTMISGIEKFIIGVINNITRNIGNTKDAINAITSKASKSVRGSVGGIINTKEEVSVTRGAVPFAKGGIVNPTPGGTFANIAEAGEAEVVSPLSTLKDMFDSVGKSIVVNITGNQISSDYDIDRIGNQLVDRLFKAGII